MIVAWVQAVKNWLAKLLGPYYARTVQIVERIATAFLGAFAAKLVGSGLDVHQIVHLSYWSAAAYAGLASVVIVAQSILTALLTGQPALLSPVSRTLRSVREHLPARGRPQHKVPVRPKRPPSPAVVLPVLPVKKTPAPRKAPAKRAAPKSPVHPKEGPKL